MATQDISRFLLQPSKHYSSLHLQQGRVITDSDWNERSNIEAEELRQTTLDIVCSRGTPNGGFEITLDAPSKEVLTPAGSYDTYELGIAEGSYYIGGLRFAVGDGEQFTSQSDWLQLTSLATNMPEEVVADGGANSRTDLVYVLGWEQPVTAVEDSELREVALGERDTSVRIKRMRRFVVETDVSSDCATAFSDLVASLEDGGKASYDVDTGELASNARLRVAAVSTPAHEDPCAEPTASGYVGAENQTIRVELRPGSKLVWGFDNAAKLYRVQVTGTSVSFLTTPADLAAMPRAGQVVEILQWGAKLPNGEKVAEAQGFVTTVATSYSPVSRLLELSASVDEAWNHWLGLHPEHHNPADPVTAQQYLYLRVWDRGGALVEDAANAEVAYTVGTGVVLGETGLEITIEADGKVGDYWIIAARPGTPEVVTPWDLGGSTGAAPHGPRRFYAPLALIEWTDDDPNVTFLMHDCRTRLRQLCGEVACTVSVGDGKQSFGDVNNLQDAIDLAGNGGKICVLPGVHQGHAVIADVEGLTIEGCGARSLLKNPQPTEPNTDFTGFASPIIEIVDSAHIVIKDLAIAGYSATGVAITEDDGVCEHIELDGLVITSGGGYTFNDQGQATSWWLPAPGITVAAASYVDIVNCNVAMANVLSFAHGVVLGGDVISMRRCRVEALGDYRAVDVTAGVNIRSGSRDVEIIGCQIHGGLGHGIALGHGRVYAPNEKPSRKAVLKEKVDIGVAETEVAPGADPNDCDCDSEDVVPNDPANEESMFFPAGVVENVRIYDNDIRNMGLSGVSTAEYWPSTVDKGAGLDKPQFCVVTDIDIARNVIENNVTRWLNLLKFQSLENAVGGVCLTASVNAWIRENTIRGNGVIRSGYPICGIGLVAAMNAVIEDNQVIDNGVRLPSTSQATIARASGRNRRRGSVGNSDESEDGAQRRANAELPRRDAQRGAARGPQGLDGLERQRGGDDPG
jgi:hypothetical protein